MKMEAKITNYKLSTNENINLRKLTDEYLDQEQTKDEILNLKNSDFMKPKYNFDHSFKVKIPTRQEWDLNEDNNNDALKFYTNAQCFIDTEKRPKVKNTWSRPKLRTFGCIRLC